MGWERMKSLPSSPSRAAVGAALTCVLTLAGVAGIAACGGGGIQERVDSFRAEHVEIIDDRGVVKMDVEKQVRALEERIKTLEAALERRGHAENAPAAPGTVPAAGEIADATAPDGSMVEAGASPRRIRRLGPQAPGRPTTETF